MIEVLGLTKRYGSVLAVDAVSLSVDEGSVTFLLGPNGAGKSTVINAIAGVVAADSGTVRIFGIDATEDPEAAKRLTGCVFEGSPLWPDMTPSGQLDFTAAVYGMDRKAAGEARDRVIELCDLGDFANRRNALLSKGMRQRVCLAQALVHGPRALILDEPASGLDPAQSDSFMRALRSVSRQTAILYSTHILGETAALGTHAVVMAGGKILEQGSFGAILGRTGTRTIAEAYARILSPGGTHGHE